MLIPTELSLKNHLFPTNFFSVQTAERIFHKRPKKHQKICLALNVTISVERQRQHEGAVSSRRS